MPFTPDTVAAQQVQERLKILYGLIQEIEKKRQICEQSIAALQRHASEEKGQNSQKTNAIIKTAMSQTDVEKEIIQKALQKIHEIRHIKNERRIQARVANKESTRTGAWMKMLQNSAQTIPLFMGNVGEKAPPLCGAVPAEKNYVAKVGDLVAALVKGEEEIWILAEVVSYNATTNKYEVDDILKEQNQKGRYSLSKSKVIPLSLMRASPEMNPEALFPEGTLVMALYPQSTCFYKAVINKSPTTFAEQYEVIFEDASYAEGFSPPMHVAQRYVFPCKIDKKRAGANTGGSSQGDSDTE